MSAYLVGVGSPGLPVFGDVLRQIRLKNKLTPEQVAKEAGVHVSFIRGIERGAQSPSMETARKIFDVFPSKTNNIRWLDVEGCDLAIKLDGLIYEFRFKAAVQGQNRRPEVEGPHSKERLRLECLALAVKAVTPTPRVDVIFMIAEKFRHYVETGVTS